MKQTKNIQKVQPVEKSKVVIIMFLYFGSIAIILSGIIFGILSLINNINFTVLSSQVHGGVFALVVAFLGIRYFLSINKLKKEVYKTSSKFSWSNFKRNKLRKSNFLLKAK